MVDTRKKDADWKVAVDQFTGQVLTHADAQVALLMDLRDELKKLNRIIGCRNFTRIPMILDAINANTRRPKRRRIK